jgi:hypothetical protein
MNENEDPSRAIRKSTLAEQGTENDLAGTTVDERIAMMWPLAVDAWAMMGVDVRNTEFRRDVGRIIELRDKQ